MDNENLKPTTADSYLNKRKETKIVKMPSGDVFEIYKMTGRDFLRQGGMGIQSVRDLIKEPSKEKRKEMLLKLTDKERLDQIDFYNKIIILGVKNPKVSIDGGNNSIPIGKIDDEDFYKLAMDIFVYSLPGGEAKLKEFHNESESNTS